MNTNSRFGALFLLFCWLSGCSESTEGNDNGQLGNPSSKDVDRTVTLKASEFRQTCGRTRGDECADCEKRADDMLDDCLSTCQSAIYDGYVMDCGEMCYSPGDACFDTCDTDQSECLELAYEFELTGERDDDLLSACQAAVTRDESCEQRSVGVDCKRYSRVERPEAVPVYQCVAQAACEQDASGCSDALGTSYLGAEVAALCPSESLDSELQDVLDMEGSWARPELIEDLGVCAELCESGTFEACVLAWISATTEY